MNGWEIRLLTIFEITFLSLGRIVSLNQKVCIALFEFYFRPLVEECILLLILNWAQRLRIASTLIITYDHDLFLSLSIKAGKSLCWSIGLKSLSHLLILGVLIKWNFSLYKPFLILEHLISMSLLFLWIKRRYIRRVVLTLGFDLVLKEWFGIRIPNSLSKGKNIFDLKDTVSFSHLWVCGYFSYKTLCLLFFE